MMIEVRQPGSICALVLPSSFEIMALLLSSSSFMSWALVKPRVSIFVALLLGLLFFSLLCCDYGCSACGDTVSRVNTLKSF